MRPPIRLVGRRSLLLGGTAAVAGCDAYNTASDRDYGGCRYDREYLVGGGQENCWPPPGTPTDLAWHLRRMNVPGAWAHSESCRRASRGAGILIGHIDTGVAEHDSFNKDAVLWGRGYDFIDKVRGGYDPLINHIEYLEQIGHGTATASVIVGRGEPTFDKVPDYKLERSISDGGHGLPTFETGEIDGQRAKTDEEKKSEEEEKKKKKEYENERPGICHGTRLDARIAGAAPAARITGAAPAAHLIPVRSFRLAATQNLHVVARAVDYLVDQKVHVITLALGWVFPSRALSDAIRRAVDANIIVLAASGNFVPWVVFPASEPNVIAVAGLGPDDTPWCGGSTGNAVTISAYGDKVWRAYRDEKSNRLDVIGPRFGTSFAVSMTAGVAALWLAHHERDRLLRHNEYRNLQEAFRAALKRTARKTDKWSTYHEALGAGIVDALALVSEKDPTKRES